MTQTKLFIYAILSFVLFISLIGCNANKTAIEPIQEQTETYQYIVTDVTSEGITGNSLTDNTGIFITHDTAGIQLKKDDHIKVSFIKDSFDEITKVVKIN